MTRIVGFRPYHVKLIDLQPVQAFVAPLLDDMAPALTKIGPAFSLVDGSEVLACAGFWDRGAHADVWAMLSRNIGSRFVALHRAVVRGLSAAPWPRVEAMVRCDFAEGCRWAERLGFVRTEARAVAPDGSPHTLWCRHG